MREEDKLSYVYSFFNATFKRGIVNFSHQQRNCVKVFQNELGSPYITYADSKLGFEWQNKSNSQVGEAFLTRK